MENKKVFVENELKNALMKADSSIKDVRYVVGKTLDIVYMEAVYIEYKNGTNNLINITGNSGIAIMHDVTKRLMAE